MVERKPTTEPLSSPSLGVYNLGVCPICEVGFIFVEHGKMQCSSCRVIVED